MNAQLCDVVTRNFPGIQLAFFELIWPAFDWIDSLHIATEPRTVSVHVHAEHLPSKNEFDDCERLLGEVFETVLAGTALHLEVVLSEHPPVKPGYREAISPAIFEKIAEDLAPWRLDMGR